MRGIRPLILALALSACGQSPLDAPFADEPLLPVEEGLIDLEPGATLDARVTRVVDGDTIHVDLRGRDVTVRLIGVDTPEVDWYGGEAECFGEEAGRYTQGLLDAERVRLEHDEERTDQYERRLAYVYLGERMVNMTLVRRGYAKVTIYPPNDRYEPQLRAAQAKARAAGLGLWSACD